MAFRVIAVALSLGVSAVVVEVALRLYPHELTEPLLQRVLINKDDDPRVEYHCFSEKINAGLVPVPDVSHGRWRLYGVDSKRIPLDRLSETPHCVAYHLSRQGIRDREYSGAPPPGTLRIGGFGDSFAYGAGLPDRDGLFRQIEARLGPGYEVVNAARPGFNIINELEYAQRIVPEAGCQRALLVWIVNDMPVDGSELATNFDRRTLKSENDADSRLGRFLRGAATSAKVGRETAEWYVDCYDPRFNGPNILRFQQCLREFAKLSCCRTAMVLYPLFQDNRDVYMYQRIHDLVASMAREAGLPVLDLAPIFLPRFDRALFLHPQDRHPSRLAHEIASKEIVRWLRDEVPGFLDQQGTLDNHGTRQ